MLLHNFICSRVISLSETLARANAYLGRALPAPLVADWMFVLRRVARAAEGRPVYRRNAYERFRKNLNYRRFGLVP